MRMLLCGIMAVVLIPMVSAAIVQDGSTVNGLHYVAWQAEDETSNVINYSTRRYWEDSTSQPAGAKPYTGSGFLLCPEKNSDNINEKNYVTYDINFTVAGNYQLYLRIGGFDSSNNESGCDSMWFQQKSGGYLVNNGGFVPENRIDDPEFEDDGNNANNALVVNDWQWFYIDEGNKIQVTQANLDAGGGVYTFTFMMGAREGGMAHDAMVAVAGAGSFADVSRDQLDLLVPEPATLGLLGLGGLGLIKRRK